MMSSDEDHSYNEFLQGLKPLTWDIWQKPVSKSKCLTPAGKSIILQEINFLRNLFGESWIARAWQKNSPMTSFQYWPINDAPVTYYNLLLLSKQLQIAKGNKGFREILNALRNNYESINWYHTMMQVELAGLAIREGFPIQFEPVILNKKADLQIDGPDQTLNFEMLSLGISDQFRLVKEYMGKISDFSGYIKITYDLHLVGYLGDDTTYITNGKPKDWTENIDILMNCIEQSAATFNPTQSYSFETPFKGILKLQNTALLPGQSTLTGVTTSKDEWLRIQARINDKAHQTEGLANTWLRMEAVGGLFHFTPWSREPLEEKLTALTKLCRNEIEQYSHISGIVISNRIGLYAGTMEDETCILATHPAYAVRRIFPYGQFKEIYIIAKDYLSQARAECIFKLYDRENSWLEWALNLQLHEMFTELR